MQNQLLVVLDTNVCLDLFVFRDPRWARLMEGIKNTRIKAITRTSCRDEWLAVLNYQHLPITDETRPSIIQTYDQWISCLNPLPNSPVRLPNCTDKDDQQFLEITRDSGSNYLITKDKALLKCSKKTKQLGLFEILTPEKFLGSVVF